MSRLLDRLERVNRGATNSMGFGNVARAEKVPPMVLLGTLSDPGKSAQGASILAQIGADGALIEGMSVEEIKEKLIKPLDKVPWGIGVQELVGEQTSHYREQGCDFVAFGPERTLLGALEDEDPAYILYIQPDMDERTLRAIEDLPVDAVLMSMKSVEPPLTLQHLITIASVRNEFSKYLLLEVTGVLTPRELEGLRDIGVDGLVVDATAHSAEELEGLRDSLLALSRRQRDKSRGSLNAVLPRSAYALPGTHSHEEDDDDEEEI